MVVGLTPKSASAGETFYFLTADQIEITSGEWPDPEGRAADDEQPVDWRRLVEGETAGGVAFSGVRTPDRSVCSYLATIDGTVVVTNSPVQLDRIASVAEGTLTALADIDDFTFFRDRYPLGAEEETGLFVLSDAFIRRLCSPRWRIGASRRTRAAAILSEMKMRHLSEFVGAQEIEKLKVDLKVLPVPPGMGEGDLSSADGEIRSATYGDMGFLTPISELKQFKATSPEVRAYNWFRNGYQRAWTNAFDPIALRLGIDDKQIEADLTVRPLSRATDYRELIAQTHRNDLAPDSGDPHPEALLHFVMAIDPSREPFEEVSSFLSNFGRPVNPYSFLGNWFSVFIDDDPMWTEMIEDEITMEDLFDYGVGGIPIGLSVETSNPLKVVGALAALRGIIESSAPGMTRWTNPEHDGTKFVTITPTEQTRQQMDVLGEELELHYATLPG